MERGRENDQEKGMMVLLREREMKQKTKNENYSIILQRYRLTLGYGIFLLDERIVNDNEKEK